MARSGAGSSVPASPLRHRHFRLMLLASTVAFPGYSLLLPVVPLWTVDQGAGTFMAGAATGVFMTSTVLVQFAVPMIARIFGYRVGLLWGALLIGVPSPVLLIATNSPAILALSFVRGAGFGLLTVCGSALIAELLPDNALARGSGLYGLAVGLPQLLGLPFGTWMVQEWGFGAVFLVAGILPLCSVVPILGLPRVFPAAGAGRQESLGSMVAATWRPWVPMLAASTGYGALATFLPIVLAPPAGTIGLFVAPAAAMTARWGAGQLGNRMGPAGRMLPAALVAGGAGLLGLAQLTQYPVLAVVSVALFGVGFGVVQNDALVLMFERTEAGTASVAWNVAFDTGQGLGAVAVGAVVSAASFPVAFSLLAVWAFGLLPVTWRGRRVRS